MNCVEVFLKIFLKLPFFIPFLSLTYSLWIPSRMLGLLYGHKKCVQTHFLLG